MIELGILKVYSDTFDNLFDFRSGSPIPGNPSWMNVNFKAKPVNNESLFIGPGIYAGFFDNQLIYIGKYLGRKANPFSGNILDARWVKHLGSMTLRGRQLSFSRSALYEITQRDLVDELVEIKKADFDTLNRDRGMLCTLNRFVFGMSNWSSFNRLNQEVLARFQFVYIRVDQHPILNHLSYETIRNMISIVEDNLVARLKPRCNAVIPLDSISHPDPPGVVSQIICKELSDCFQANHVNTLSTQIIDHNIETTMAPSTHNHNKPTKITMGDEPESAEDIFLEHMENAPSPATQLIINIREYYEGMGDIEIHFKKRSPADLRVRVCRGIGRGRNVFTIQWRPTRSEFLCMSLAASTNCNYEGVYGSGQTNAGEPLCTQFRLSGNNDNTDTMIKLVNAAITEFDNGIHSR